jgi:hypothetical protein
MKSTELRIGNWIYEDNEISCVTPNTLRDMFQVEIIHEEIKNYKPIPIRNCFEQLVNHFDFVDISNSNERIFKRGKFVYYSSLDEVIVELNNGHQEYDLYTGCQYIHELQNLYFIINKEELK